MIIVLLIDDIVSNIEFNHRLISFKFFVVCVVHLDKLY